MGDERATANLRIYAEVNVAVKVRLTRPELELLGNGLTSEEMDKAIMRALGKRLSVPTREAPEGEDQFIAAQVTDCDGQDVPEQPYICS
ncbi:MAG TPA: hypothetical protein VMY35_11285 [Phycisphaerae bacterium]|nr:hypothetical protein [Phycisphaerae bacterium]